MTWTGPRRWPGRSPDPDQQARALAALAEAAAGAGDLDRARALAERAEMAARAITSPDQQARALAELAEAVAGAGDLDRARALAGQAETVARAITEPGRAGGGAGRPGQEGCTGPSPVTTGAGTYRRSLEGVGGHSGSDQPAAVNAIADEYLNATSLPRNPDSHVGLQRLARGESERERSFDSDPTH